MYRSRVRATTILVALLATVSLYGCSAVAAAPLAGPSSHVPVPGGRPSATPTHRATTATSRAPLKAYTSVPSWVVRARQTRPSGSGPGGSLLRTGSNAVALTFDDGPDPVYTPKMLDLLKRTGVKATFCVIGYRVKAYPALVRRIVAEGHTICNHTWDHRLDLAKESDAAILKDLTSTNKAIHAAAPAAKISYFRAPGGNFTSHLVALAASLGMKSIYWAVDPRDWDFPTYGHGASMVNHIIVAVAGHVRPGAIILSHDARKPDTITAYAVLIPWLKARYKLIPLPV